MEKLINISELAIELDLVNPKNKKPLNYVLRYWERQFSQIKPKIINKRRYYSKDQVEIFKMIKYFLKNQGLTINGVKNLLNSKINKKKVIIVIPKNKNNDELKKYLKKKYNLKIFRGSEKNVYKRVSDCCKKYKVQNFIRITADNVLLDPILINKAIQFYIQNNSDYLSTRTMDHTNKWNVTSDYNEGSSIEIINVKNLFNISKLVRKKIVNTQLGIYFQILKF